MKGGSTKIGKDLYDIYDVFRNFWVYPANVVAITILAIIEIINFGYYRFVSPYTFLYIYLIVYGSVSVLVQKIAFIVNYKGRTVDHYYGALFRKR